MRDNSAYYYYYTIFSTSFILVRAVVGLESIQTKYN